MKKLIPGMFSSISDAELIIATHGYDDTAPENVTDKFSEHGDNNSLTRTDNSSIMSKATDQEVFDYESMQEGLDNTLS